MKADNGITAQDGPKRGYVYLVGAGPGDPELLTLKAARVLQEADVILYDDLVSSDLVAQFSAEKIYTGKRKDSHHFEQDEINAEILRHVRDGKVVARLKGGDPFIFGRGGEEIAVLRESGVGYEIVPGITAAHGASAYAEIPLTIRKVSSSVAFCTGHPVSKIEVPNTDTIVFYMVASTVHEVLDAVALKGRSEETPVAIVQNATRYNQKIITGTLGELRLREREVYSPALLIVGESIRHSVADNWYSKKRKILVAGCDSRLSCPGDAVEVHFPCKRVDGADHDRVRQAVEHLEQWSALLFSDELAVAYFFRYLMECGKDVRHLGKCLVYAAGSGVARALKRQGVVADRELRGEPYGDIAELLEVNGISEMNILHPTSTIGDDEAESPLASCGNVVTPLSVYAFERAANEEPLDIDFIDEIYFSSPSCVRNFRIAYSAIPGNITVTTANQTTQDEYLKLFGNAASPQS